MLKDKRVLLIVGGGIAAYKALALVRRLKDEGSSYQQIKDNLRRDTAVYFLSRPELSIDEIALQLGFSEPSAFHRAFKKWTGVTPGVYRQEKSLRPAQD